MILLNDIGILFNKLKLCRSIEIDTADILVVDSIKKHIVIKATLKVNGLIDIILSREFIKDLSIAKYMQAPSKIKNAKRVLKTYIGLEKYFLRSLFKRETKTDLFL